MYEEIFLDRYFVQHMYNERKCESLSTSGGGGSLCGVEWTTEKGCDVICMVLTKKENRELRREA